MPSGPARRLILGALATLLVALFALPAGAGEQPVRAVRIWPAADYTRLTLESAEPLRYNLLSLKNPDRLVLDLEDVEPDQVQGLLAGKILPIDPYIGAARVGRFKPSVARLVLDLKEAVKPQIFVLAPVGDYGHRLVLDLYPAVAPDPLMALLQKQELDPALAGPVDPSATKSVPDGARPRGAPKPAVARLITVAIDAGHGGEDPGAKGRRGTYEKSVTLLIARKLKAVIDAEPNMRALLTRDGDYYIALGERVDKARRVKADLFVSVHADAFVKPHARGSSVFALSERGATSTAAQWLAKRENDADLIGGVNLNRKDRYLAMTLADLSLTAQISDSLKLGNAVLSELGGINALHKARVEQAGFAVLKAPDVPSILVETAFISNPDEERRLNSEAYQEKIATAIFRGIKSYFAKNPPLSRSTLAANL